MEAELFDEPPVDWPIDESADTDSANHSALLANIQRITSKGRSTGTNQLRDEAAANISEFYAPPCETTSLQPHCEADEGGRAGGVSVHELLDSLGDRRQLASLRKQLSKSKRQKTLAEPAETKEAVRGERVAGYERARRNTTRWQSVVEQRRRAAQLNFPLRPPSLRVDTARQITDSADRWRSPLERQIAALLGASEAVPRTGEALSGREQRVLAAMSLEEALERRHELAKNRALLTYQEARNRRQNRIKSRRYRRSVKQQMMRQHLAEFERLRVCDPEAAMTQLRRIEERRVEERATQRHRNTGRWARMQALRRHYDPEARRALEESLRVGRELKQKQDADGPDDPAEEQEEDEEQQETHHADIDPDNPWMSADGRESNSVPPLSSSTTEDTTDYMEIYSRQEAIKQLMRQTEQEEGGEEDMEEDEASHVVGQGIRKNQNVVSSADSQKKVKKQAKKTTKKESNKKVHFAEEQNGTFRSATSNKKLQSVDEIFDSLEQKKGKKIKESTKQKKRKAGDKKSKSTEEQVGELGVSEQLEEEGPPLNTETNMDPSADRLPSAGDLDTAEQHVKRAIHRLLAGGEEEDRAKKLASASSTPVSASKPLTSVKHAAVPDLCVDTDHLLDQEAVGAATGRSSAVQEDQQDQERRLTLAEAFADDDVLVEFRREKQKQTDADQPKDIDRALPGWGDWGGEGIQISARKRRQLRIRAPRLARRDRRMAHVILSERANEGARAHQVTQLPHYTRAVAAFESAMRAPVGRTWLPARAHSELVRPAVVTRPGVLIEPMDESMLLNKDKKSRKPDI